MVAQKPDRNRLITDLLITSSHPTLRCCVYLRLLYGNS
jgi:hypothetical protein